MSVHEASLETLDVSVSRSLRTIVVDVVVVVVVIVVLQQVEFKVANVFLLINKKNNFLFVEN